MRKKGFLKFLLITVLSLSVGLIVSAAAKDKLLELITPVYETLRYIEMYFYDKDDVDYEKVIDYSIDGLLKGLGDKFSHYVSPQMIENERIEMGGEYGGLGIEVTWDKELGAVEVVAPMYGTPAWRAGIKAGDKIIEIDGQPTNEMTFLEAVKKLRGKPGTTVKIKVIREGVKEPLVFEIIREKIVLVPVKYSVIHTTFARVGYVKITKFMDKTYDDLLKALNEIVKSYGVDAMIIDLRDNPGGYLDQAVKVAGIFLKDGEIVRIRNVKGEEEIYFVKDGKIWKKDNLGTLVYHSKEISLPKMPVIVIVNNGSASASEIVTGALKDNGVAIVVGKKTFGKGSVQTGFPLSNGGILYLTTAHYITPSGRDIHGLGIEPDYVVEGEEKREDHEAEVKGYTQRTIDVSTDDPYIKKALDVLKEELK